MKKNILIIGADDAPGGVANYVNSIVSHNSDKYIYHAITFESKGYLSSSIIKHNMPKTYNFLSIINRIIQLRRLIIKIQPQLIHTHTARAGILATIASKGLGISTIYSGHSWRFEQESNAIKKIYFKAIEKFISTNSSFVTFLTKNDLDTGINLNLVNPKQAAVINTRINVPYFLKSKLDRKAILYKYNIAEYKKIIINTGTLDERKNPNLFIAIAKNLAQELNNIHFIWIGDGNKKKEVDQIIKYYKLEKIITLTGCLSNKETLDLVNIADCFLFTSKFEGVPLSLIEAKLSKIPIVSSDYPSVNAIIRDGIDGYIFNKKSPEQASSLIKKVLEDPLQSQIITQNGYDFALKENTNAQTMSNEFCNLYDIMTSSKNPA